MGKMKLVGARTPLGLEISGWEVDAVDFDFSGLSSACRDMYGSSIIAINLSKHFSRLPETKDFDVLLKKDPRVVSAIVARLGVSLYEANKPISCAIQDYLDFVERKGKAKLFHRITEEFCTECFRLLWEFVHAGGTLVLFSPNEREPPPSPLGGRTTQKFPTAWEVWRCLLPRISCEEHPGWAHKADGPDEDYFYEQNQHATTYCLSTALDDGVYSTELPLGEKKTLSNAHDYIKFLPGNTEAGVTVTARDALGNDKLLIFTWGAGEMRIAPESLSESILLDLMKNNQPPSPVDKDSVAIKVPEPETRPLPTLLQQTSNVGEWNKILFPENARGPSPQIKSLEQLAATIEAMIAESKSQKQPANEPVKVRCPNGPSDDGPSMKETGRATTRQAIIRLILSRVKKLKDDFGSIANIDQMRDFLDQSLKTAKTNTYSN